MSGSGVVGLGGGGGGGGEGLLAGGICASQDTFSSWYML